jgi:fructose-specific component phosphotransferase system IIB-like protein
MFDANDLASFQGIQIRTAAADMGSLDKLFDGKKCWVITISRAVRATPDEASGATHSKS